MQDAAIYKVPVNGGAAQRVDAGGANVTSPWVHAVDSTYVYFANSSAGSDGSVARVPKAGGVAQILVANVRPWSMVVDAANVYFSDQPFSSNGSIKRVAKSCTAPCSPTVMVPDLRSTVSRSHGS